MTPETADEQSGLPLAPIFAVKRLLDALIDVPACLEIFERNHPGAEIAIRAWATENDLTILDEQRPPLSDGMPGYRILRCWISVRFNHHVTVYL
jgi:hypothetical protein